MLLLVLIRILPAWANCMGQLHEPIVICFRYSAVSSVSELENDIGRLSRSTSQLRIGSNLG